MTPLTLKKQFKGQVSNQVSGKVYAKLLGQVNYQVYNILNTKKTIYKGSL